MLKCSLPGVSVFTPESSSCFLSLLVCFYSLRLCVPMTTAHTPLLSHLACLSVCVFKQLGFHLCLLVVVHVSLYCSLDVPGFLFEDYEFFLSFCLFLIKVVHASGFSLSLIPTLHILNGRFI